MNSDPITRFNDPSRLILFFLAIIGLYGSWIYTQNMPGADYYVAWVVADATRSDRDYNVYDVSDHGRMQADYRELAFSEDSKSRRAAFSDIPLFTPTASPFLYTTVNALSSHRYETSLKIWSALSLAGFAIAIGVFCHLLGYAKSVSLVIFVACVFWMDAYQSDIRVANTNSFQLGVLALLYFLLSRDDRKLYLLLASALAAMLALYKLNLAPVGLLLLGAWLIRGQYSRLFVGLAGMAIGTLFAVVSSSLFFGGPEIWLEWLQKAFLLSEGVVSAEVGNINLLGLLGLEVAVKGKIALALALCAVTLAFLWWGRKASSVTGRESAEARRESDRIEYALLIGMGSMIFLMVSPLVWLHYYVLAMPMLLVSLRPWSRVPAQRRLYVLLFRLVPILVLLASLQGAHWYFMRDDYVTARSLANAISSLVLFGLGLWQLRFRDASDARVAA